MNVRILAVGDVVGDSGVDFLSKKLRGLKKLYDVHFTVVNGENVSCVGIMPGQVDELYAAGADVVTLGNHTFGKNKRSAGERQVGKHMQHHCSVHFRVLQNAVLYTVLCAR